MQGRWKISKGLFLSSILHGHKGFSYLRFFTCGTDSKAGWTLVIPCSVDKTNEWESHCAYIQEFFVWV